MALAQLRCPQRDIKVHNTPNHGIIPRTDEKWPMVGRKARRVNPEDLSRLISSDV
jgi:hypothetical protein